MSIEHLPEVIKCGHNFTFQGTIWKNLAASALADDK
jgi:hypothetical protein